MNKDLAAEASLKADVFADLQMYLLFVIGVSVETTNFIMEGFSIYHFATPEQKERMGKLLFEAVGQDIAGSILGRVAQEVNELAR